jgi:hypothetical protein
MRAWTWHSHHIEDLGPYTERIDLCFEPFFVKEIRRVIEWLREIKTADQYCYKFLACNLVLFNNPIINFINQEISAERKRSIIWFLQLCLRHKQTKLRFMPTPSLNSSPLGVHRTTVASPPGECCGGRTHSPGGEGGGGSIFWKTQDTALYST